MSQDFHLPSGLVTGSTGSIDQVQCQAMPGHHVKNGFPRCVPPRPKAEGEGNTQLPCVHRVDMRRRLNEGITLDDVAKYKSLALRFANQPRELCEDDASAMSKSEDCTEIINLGRLGPCVPPQLVDEAGASSAHLQH